MRRNNSFLFFLLILFLVQACSSLPPQKATPYRKKPVPQQVIKESPQQIIPKRPVTLSTNSIVQKISDQANQLMEDGELDAAAQTLERGIRIAPKDALLWSQLATVRLKQERYGQAQSLAAKSSSLATNNIALLDKNRSIIEAAGR